jgi:two-component system, LytTR family, sensor kinase
MKRLTEKQFLVHEPRVLQHLAFWVLSYIVFVQVFKSGASAEKIDYVYAALFHAFLIPAVYINLYMVLSKLATGRRWLLFIVSVIAIIALFSWLNFSFFQSWSKYLLPDYFFISYFTIWEVSLFFVVYICISSLLKLSKSWFAVNELQRQLLQTEKEKVQIELQALKSQINPHFFFNTLNGIYSMTLDKDERLPETVLQLSHLMRYFLYESTGEMVPLEKEWQVLEDYIALQKIRSSQQLHIEKKIEGEIQQQQIAPLVLITFLENAFKHGAKGNTGPATIRLLLQVRENEFTFRVENTKGVVDAIDPNEYKGVGLKNVQRRLELLYPNRHRLDIKESSDLFIVTLHIQT